MKGNAKPFLHAEVDSKVQSLLMKFLRSVEYKKLDFTTYSTENQV